MEGYDGNRMAETCHAELRHAQLITHVGGDPKQQKCLTPT